MTVHGVSSLTYCPLGAENNPTYLYFRVCKSCQKFSPLFSEYEAMHLLTKPIKHFPHIYCVFDILTCILTRENTSQLLAYLVPLRFQPIWLNRAYVYTVVTLTRCYFSHYNNNKKTPPTASSQRQ